MVDRATLPLQITWTRGSNQALIDLDGQKIPLKTGEWSQWVYLDFKINFIIRVHGMVQLLLMNANNELQLYVSPVNFRPDNPPTPMSYPESFAGEIFKSMGPYRTLGWAEAGYVLFSGVNVPSKAFGEVVEHQCETPNVDAAELKRRIDSGEDIVVATALDRAWGTQDGTSFASPLVAGAAAWVWTMRPNG